MRMPPPSSPHLAQWLLHSLLSKAGEFASHGKQEALGSLAMASALCAEQEQRVARVACSALP